MWGPSQPAGSGTKHVGARLTPRVLGQNMLGLVSPQPSPPITEWGLWDKTRGGPCAKNNRTPLAGRIALQSPLLTLLPAGPGPRVDAILTRRRRRPYFETVSCCAISSKNARVKEFTSKSHFFHEVAQFVSHETGSSKHFLIYIVSNCKRLHQMIHSFENKHDLRILSRGVTNR